MSQDATEIAPPVETAPVDPVATVMKLFELTMKRDLEGLKAMVLPDCVFSITYPAHTGFGGEAVGFEAGAAMLMRMDEQLEAIEVEPKDMIVQDNTIVMHVEEKVRARATGKTATNTFVSITKLQDGKLASSRVFPNTFAVMELLRPDEAPARTRPATKKSAAGGKKKSTVRATRKAGAGKSKARPVKKGKSAAGGKKKTARARG